MIPIAKPSIGEEEKRAVQVVLDSGMLAQGPQVSTFEEEFAHYIGVPQAIATSNGTTALHAALVSLGIGEGDEVITSSFSFIATANAITMCGAKPVFIDICEDSFLMNADLIEAAITARTRAIMPVHLFGRAVDMDKVMAIAEKYHLAIIEDACQAHGAMWKGQKVGSFGVGCFSFYPTKNMTTGEGGMITVRDGELAAGLRKLITHGSSVRYYHEFLGYNYRMTDIAAAIGREQLKKLELFNSARRKNALVLTQKLGKVKGLCVPEVIEGHVFHQYSVRVVDGFGLTRDELKNYLTEQGIGNSVFYPVPIHKQKAYENYNQLSLPITEKVAQQVLSLPVHPLLSNSEIHTIVEAFENLERGKR